jgi:hypothetical protein
VKEVLEVPVVMLQRRLLIWKAKAKKELEELADEPEENQLVREEGASKLYSILYVWAAALLVVATVCTQVYPLFR